jgi:tetratricopeptide (TPR) repeat protein
VPRLLTLRLAALLLAAPFAAAAAPDDPAALMEGGHFKQARALIEAREKTNPDDASTLYLLARLKLVSDDARAALPLAERAATLEPKNADYRYQVAACVGSMAQRAGTLKKLGLAKRFKREAEAALALDARHLDAYEGLIEFYSVAPGIAGGDDKRALALAEAMVGIDPVRGRLAQATLGFRDKHPEQAEQAFRQALQADSNSYRALLSLASFCAGDAQKKWDEAERHARAARVLYPGRVGAWSMLAYLYAHLQRWDDLDRTLAEAERAVPDNLAPCYQAARTLLADDREPARAERWFRKYLAQEPEFGAPTLAHAHWRLGLAIEKQGRRSEALGEVQTALQLKPDLDQAKKDLKRLKRG